MKPNFRRLIQEGKRLYRKIKDIDRALLKLKSKYGLSDDTLFRIGNALLSFVSKKEKINKIASDIIKESKKYISGTYKKVYIAPSKIHGNGVFIGEPIKKDDYIGVSHIKKSEEDNFSTELGKYHNHSWSPNCENVLEGYFRFLVARKNLSPGDEITTDYSLQPELEQPESDWK